MTAFAQSTSPLDADVKDKAQHAAQRASASVAPSTANAPRVLILADDLSGAADCAVTGAKLGLRSHVVLHQQAAQQLSAEAEQTIDVLAIDLDCRRQSSADAAQVHTEAWHTLGHADVRLYKKVDSTLRGNVASEIAALTQVAGMAIVAPAFPSAGRTTVAAHQLLHGVPLEETEVWRNEHIPGRADLLDMLSSAGLRTVALSLDSVRALPDALTKHLIGLQASGVQAVICDAQTDDDLFRIAQASVALRDVFWVGSAGLARVWLVAQDPGPKHASERDSQRAAPMHPQGANVADRRPVLAVVGSMSSISHAQVAALRAEAGEAMFALEIDTQYLLHEASHNPRHSTYASDASVRADSTSSTPADVTSQVAEALRAGRDVLVSLSQKDRSRVADGLLLCEALARLLAPAVALAGTVIATGGETARALLGAADVHSLRIVDEIEHGVPLMHATRPVDPLVADPAADRTQAEVITAATESASGKLLQVITKAGGFGTPQTLITAWRRASMPSVDQDSLSPSYFGPTSAPGAEDRPFHEELTQ